jgi:hypothetical protein
VEALHLKRCSHRTYTHQLAVVLHSPSPTAHLQRTIQMISTSSSSTRPPANVLIIAAVVVFVLLSTTMHMSSSTSRSSSGHNEQNNNGALSNNNNEQPTGMIPSLQSPSLRLASSSVDEKLSSKLRKKRASGASAIQPVCMFYEGQWTRSLDMPTMTFI